MSMEHEMSGFPRPYHLDDPRLTLVIEWECIGRQSFEEYEDPEHARKYYREFSAAWARREVRSEDEFNVAFPRPLTVGQRKKREIDRLRELHHIADWKGDITKQHAERMSQIASESYDQYQNPEEARGYYLQKATAEFELYNGRLGRFPFNQPRLVVGKRNSTNEDVPEETFRELSQGSGPMGEHPNKGHGHGVSGDGSDLRYGDIVGADGRLRGGPRDDDLGGTPSRMSGTSRQGWPTRRDC